MNISYISHMLNNILFNKQLIDYREKRKYHAWMEIQ